MQQRFFQLYWAAFNYTKQGEQYNLIIIYATLQIPSSEGQL
jgi:hypothetical protein